MGHIISLRANLRPRLALWLGCAVFSITHRYAINKKWSNNATKEHRQTSKSNNSDRTGIRRSDQDLPVAFRAKTWHVHSECLTVNQPAVLSSTRIAYRTAFARRPSSELHHFDTKQTYLQQLHFYRITQYCRTINNCNKCLYISWQCSCYSIINPKVFHHSLRRSQNMKPCTY